MIIRKKFAKVVGLTFALALFASAMPSKAADDNRPSAPATKPAAGMFYELRIYTAAPGKMDALNKRFREHTLRLFEKHGIKSIAYWSAVDEKHQGKLYYVIAYPDQASREQMLVKGIAKDPEFAKAVAESEKDGKLTTEIESVLMTPTDYSPLK